jgi:pimeloyl-ACP methyl ester carboxylesterase
MRTSACRALIGLLALTMVAAPSTLLATGIQDESAGVEYWKGALIAPSGELEFFVTFTPDGDGYTATVSIPAQGATDLPVQDVVYSAEEIRFSLMAAPPSGAHWVGKPSEDFQSAEGEFSQGAATLPFKMERVEEEAAGATRPQHPRPPFPYEARDVTYTNPVEGNTLAGTLTIPPGAGPHPAALLITGSGSQDRDETILGHKPFLVIADHLTRNGIAVLRADDRGIGGSNGVRADLTSEDFAGDVLAGVSFLAEQPEIDAGRIGLIGHSEGGMIAPMVAARSPSVAYIVLLSGTAISGYELMPMQVASIQRSVGRPEDNIEQQLVAYRRMMDLIVEGASSEAVREALIELVDVQFANLPEDAPARQPEAKEQLVASQLAQVMSPWFRFFFTFDPREALREVTCPVLALGGTLDLQVPPDANLPVIEQTLVEAGNTDVTTVELEGLNHLFQTATTGSPTEYAQIEETFSPAALDLITAWISERMLK